MTHFWIGIASKNHVLLAVKDGFAQLGHGRHSAVKNLKEGDWIAYYSPKTNMNGGDIVQAFTAIGQVVSEESYQVESSSDFKPYRVNVDYRVSARDADIHPLLDKLSFTKDRGNKWGFAFRRSKIKIDEADFSIIGDAMGLKRFN